MSVEVDGRERKGNMLVGGRHCGGRMQSYRGVKLRWTIVSVPRAIEI